MKRSLFVYFRVERLSEGAVISAVRSLHAARQSEMPGLRCELLRRVDDDSAVVTLMETYVAEGGVSMHWQALIEREACAHLQPWLVGERHTEVFEPCA